jgi:hypothetical protein
MSTYPWLATLPLYFTDPVSARKVHESALFEITNSVAESASDDS